MYRRVGDAPSYRAVRDHFDFMRRLIGAHGGGVVKTIGDAVMAAFVDPADGLAAALAIQRQSLASAEGLTIKLGLHWGPAIAVNANDLLDYFGQTVNLAARLQEESEGGDVVLAAALAEDPSAARLLSDDTLRIERFQAAVRGLEGPIAMIRVIPRAEPASAGRSCVISAQKGERDNACSSGVRGMRRHGRGTHRELGADARARGGRGAHCLL
jgi:class 3 adenylate cyclase